MAQITAITPTESSVAVTSALSAIIHTAAYGGVSVSADALATTEEVDIYVVAGGAAKILTNAAGTAQKLTATIPALHLEGGPTYRFAKVQTASACGVYVDLQTP